MDKRKTFKKYWGVDELEVYCPVQASCTYVSFVSQSAGKKKKKGMKTKERRKRRAREVELVKYGKRTWSLSDTPRNGLDVIESEVFGIFPIPDNISMHGEFLRRLRNSHKR